ncbi:DDE-type integrase/transposase/recombinase [Saccharothrix hoggarensis]|uniref:DDE-type integrase/transposase/recombinase n=1 Tax=Saccharothrix hoggarensis TaxID=913853 RepID=A0ABW3QP11_9PSEU
MARLLGLRERGVLSRAEVRAAAAAVRVSERTVDRWLAKGRDYTRPMPASRFLLDETDMWAFEYYAGQVSAVHRARSAAVAGRDRIDSGVPIPTFLLAGWRGARPVAERTLYAAFDRELSPAERAFWTGGDTARDALRVYRRRVAGHRNEIWQTDHAQLKILVLPRRGAPVHPWLTSIIDAYSRVQLGWVLSERRPTAQTVLAALRDAILRDPARGDHGGVPQFLECDRGSEFTSDPVHRFAAGLGIRIVHSPPRRPHYHGRIERWHDTVTRMLLVHLPGYTRGPRDRHGRLCAPIRDDIAWITAHPTAEDVARHHGDHHDLAQTTNGLAHAPETVDSDSTEATVATAVAPMLTWKAFVDQYTRWVHWYNTAHRHGGLAGRSPLRAWRADPTPLMTIAPELLRDLLLGPERRVIGKSGIRNDNLHYSAEVLDNAVGRTVQIRYAPHDDRFVEVYDRNGVHLATATPSETLTVPEARARDAARGRDTANLLARRRAAIARARRRDEPVGPPALQPMPVPPQPASTTPTASSKEDIGNTEAGTVGTHDIVVLPPEPLPVLPATAGQPPPRPVVPATPAPTSPVPTSPVPTTADPDAEPAERRPVRRTRLSRPVPFFVVPEPDADLDDPPTVRVLDDAG